jgi:hypothetical protein
VFVVTADQRRSRRVGDRVPAALDALNTRPRLQGLRRRFERTAGDEIQGVCEAADGVVTVVRRLVRLDGWRIGVGAGEVDRPLPRSTRAGSGAAFVAARRAVERARRSPQQVAVVGVRSYGHGDPARDAESALWLTCSVLRRRTEEGWEVVDLLDDGHSQVEIASKLGITESAVSQRVSRAGWLEERRGRELCVLHLGLADVDG